MSKAAPPGGYGAPTGKRPKIPLKDVLVVERVPFRSIRWRWEVLWYAALNVAAMLPLQWVVPSNDPDGLPLPAMAGMFAATALLAYLQPWVGVLSVLRAMRIFQMVLLPLTFVLGVLSIPIAVLEPGPDPDVVRLIAAFGAAAAALMSLFGQIRLWRTTAWTLQLEAQNQSAQ